MSTTRRQFLQGAGIVATTPGTGIWKQANGSNTPPTPEDGSVLDVREFGARIDGRTDDTNAINRAILAAEQGDTVYIPPGTTRVMADSGPAILIDGRVSDDVTVTGNGPDTFIQMGDVDESKHSRCIGIDASGAKINGLSVGNMRVSGNKRLNGNYSSMGIQVYPRGDGHDIRIHDVTAVDCSGKGIGIGGGFVRLDRITAIGNTRHGVAMRAPSRPWGEWSVNATSIYSRNNGGLGIDHNGGSVRIDGFWLENNGQGGAKVPRRAKESWWYNGTFIRNDTMGFRFNGDHTNQRYNPMRIHLDNVVAREHPWSGFSLGGNVEYDIGRLVAIKNNTQNRQNANVIVINDADVVADEIYSADAGNGYGLHMSSTGSVQIANYQHESNASGPFGGNLSSVSVGTATESARANPNLGAGPDDIGAGGSYTPAPTSTPSGPSGPTGPSGPSAAIMQVVVISLIVTLGVIACFAGIAAVGLYGLYAFFRAFI